MDIVWTIVFGLLGTGALIYLGWDIFSLSRYPRSLLALNRLSSDHGMTWPDRFKAAKLILLFIITCFAMYEVAHFFLGWMPENWGNADEDGEWVTTRRSMSMLFAMYAGGFLFEGLGRGIKAQVRVSELEVERLLIEEIDKAYSIEKLADLRKDFELVASKGTREVESPMWGYIRKIEDRDLPHDVQRELFMWAVNMIDKRLSKIKSMGADISDAS